MWRHVTDLEKAGERGFYFDEAKAIKAIDFSRCCNLFEGEWAGKPIKLRPEQKFIVWCLIGWRQSADGLRRFRQAQLEVGRKWGKSSFAAYIACLLLHFDDPIERGAQGYVAAPLDVDTPIPTVDGWKNMGELQVGDIVFTEGGLPTTVTYVSPVMLDRECYAVRFHDGSQIVSDAEHRWPVSSILAGRPSLAGVPMSEVRGTSVSMRCGVSIRTTDDIRKTLTTSRGDVNHSISVAEAMTLPHVELPIPPYTFGAWLGDGRSNRGSIAFLESDSEIAENIVDDGYELSRHFDHQGLLRFTVLGLRTQLRTNGLIDAKHVPPIYLRASESQRLSLLQGLMDTDGTCTKTGECRFTNRNKNIADGVYELATTLGLLANAHEITVTGAPHYVVSFKAPSSLPVFRLKRKAERQRERVNPRATRRFIVAVDKVPSRPVRCIRVDAESHLFLAGRGMIPTHNTKQDQAKIVWKCAQKMIERSPALAKRSIITPSRLTIDVPEYDSIFRPIASDSKTVDGFNPHFVIKDEEHAWREMHRGLADTLASGFGARSQPLTITITTYGDDDSLIWIENHDYAVKCLESVITGEIIDDAWFAFICALDYPKEQPCYQCKGENCPWCGGTATIPIDDPYDEKNWRKANPGIGLGPGFTPKLERMRESATVARQRPDKEPEFFQKNLNIRVSARNKVILPETWSKSAGELTDTTGVTGRGGLDLGRTNDFAATAMVFPFDEVDDDGESFRRYEAVTKMWTVADRPEELKTGFIERWIAQGYLEESSGDAVDFMDVEESIIAWSREHTIGTWAYDPDQARVIAQRLTENNGLEMFAFTQSPKYYTEPLREFLNLLGKCRMVNGVAVSLFKHNGNPCFAWQAGNLIVESNSRGQQMPDKSQNKNKIDAMVALLMAFSECLYHQTGDINGYYLNNSLSVGKASEPAKTKTCPDCDNRVHVLTRRCPACEYQWDMSV